MVAPYCIRVHNYHLDGYQHVNNARYLEFLEAARWHFFRECGLHEAMRQLQLVVVRVDIRYRHAAVHDDVLSIDTKMLSVQSRLLGLQQDIGISGSLKLAASAAVTLMPTYEGKVFRLPETVLIKLNDLI